MVAVKGDIVGKMVVSQPLDGNGDCDTCVRARERSLVNQIINANFASYSWWFEIQCVLGVDAVSSHSLVFHCGHFMLPFCFLHFIVDMNSSYLLFLLMLQAYKTV